MVNINKQGINVMQLGLYQLRVIPTYIPFM